MTFMGGLLTTIAQINCSYHNTHIQMCNFSVRVYIRGPLFQFRDIYIQLGFSWTGIQVGHFHKLHLLFCLPPSNLYRNPSSQSPLVFLNDHFKYHLRITFKTLQRALESLSNADRVYVSLGTAGTYPGYVPAVPRET